MTKLRDVIKTVEEIAPGILQESYDNSGLIVGSPDTDVHKALISLDITEEVVEEAIKGHCDLIISHHPLIFKPIKKIDDSSWISRCLINAIKNDISMYSVHTNLDNVISGVNGFLAEKMGLKDCRVLLPKGDLLRKLVTFCPVDHAEEVRNALFSSGAGHIGNYDSCSFNSMGTGSFRGLQDTDPFVGEAGTLHFENEMRIEVIYPVYLERKILRALIVSHPYEEVAYDIFPLKNFLPEVGAGIAGVLEFPVNEKEFLKFIKNLLGIPFLRHSKLLGREIQRVALCGGSGSFLIHEAINNKADVFISSDIKYHDYFESDGKIVIVDAGHYETEQFTKDLLYKFLKEKFPNFALQISKENTNPVFYY